MTNEEAIKQIVAYVYFNIEDIPEEVGEAFNLAIKALERPQVTVFAENASKEEIEDFKQELENVLACIEQSKWIPVSERLPEKMGTYLVTLEYKEHGKGITTLWYHGKGIGWDLRVADVVIAWQPLPEPYKEEGAE